MQLLYLLTVIHSKLLYVGQSTFGSYDAPTQNSEFTTAVMVEIEHFLSRSLGLLVTQGAMGKEER